MSLAPPRDALVSDADAASPKPTAPISQTRRDEGALTWTVHLARRNPAGRARVFACVAAVAFIGLLLFQNLWLSLLPAAAVLFSVSEYVFPATYTLTREKAALRCGLLLLEMPWRDVRHAYLTEDGIKLSPLRVKNARMEALRGIFLRFDDNEEAVTDTVRRLRSEAADV